MALLRGCKGAAVVGGARFSEADKLLPVNAGRRQFLDALIMEAEVIYFFTGR
jgi:hypothetical protein